MNETGRLLHRQLRAPKSVVRDFGTGSQKQPFAALRTKVQTGRKAAIRCEQVNGLLSALRSLLKLEVAELGTV